MFLRLCFLITGTIHMAWGHGFLRDPPMRGYMRAVFSQCTNYNRDYNMMGQNCGGMAVQYNSVNMGRCAACGEEFSIPLGTRKNEYGGIYAPKDVGRVYVKGSIIKVEVEITAAHKGWYEIRLCNKEETMQGDLDKCFSGSDSYYTLPFVDNNYDTRYPVTDTKLYTNFVKLPDGITCNRCVIQWWYRTNNNWNSDVQEHFVNCADIAIVEPTTTSNDIRNLASCPYNPLEVQSINMMGQDIATWKPNYNYSTGGAITWGQQGENQSVNLTTKKYIVSTTQIPPQNDSSDSSTLVILCVVCNIENMQSSKICSCCQKQWKSLDKTNAMDDWCTRNCNNNPPFCPQILCNSTPVYTWTCK
ncbi:hypothetical protein CHS0354_041642 [Potamilus streckersoni]|uniref:Chitin-binding type-4 domain-containing protein n=1 Tax=Potamilus streckersoni TaxID=2493646 RepID=A0AAE0SD47_9BIVA|nr:hypothetical protein CHS0354_041642 [Potamilus streckersoni]